MTTLFLTPSDPFSPFDPTDPFREFRGGVDALRQRVYPGPLSEVDVVVRPTSTVAGDELTALGRGLATIRGELSGWAGVLYDEAAGAFGASGSLGSWALRGEGTLRDGAGDLVFRGSVGIDRRFSPRTSSTLYGISRASFCGTWATGAGSSRRASPVPPRIRSR